MSIFDLYDDAELVRSFGSVTLARGREYADRGRVVTMEISDANPRITVVHGQVEGSGGRTYGTHVTLVEDPSGAWLDARCTCPVVRMCKHAAALVVLAVEQRAGAPGPAREWERRLGLVLEELDRTVEERRLPKRPLALQV
jgi:uncharacterized Zn finger protein